MVAIIFGPGVVIRLSKKTSTNCIHFSNLKGNSRVRQEREISDELREEWNILYLSFFLVTSFYFWKTSQLENKNEVLGISIAKFLAPYRETRGHKTTWIFMNNAATCFYVYYTLLLASFPLVYIHSHSDPARVMEDREMKSLKLWRSLDLYIQLKINLFS